jgi:hypothetical protein
MQNRLDGYNDGYGNTFQGVRSQDSNAGQWSTPDAYAGDVHDPMSQKPYMYNRNNPLEYEDPNGYTWFPNGYSLFSAIYNWLIGDDISTLKSPTTSAGAKMFAVVSIAELCSTRSERSGACSKSHQDSHRGRRQEWRRKRHSSRYNQVCGRRR